MTQDQKTCVGPVRLDLLAGAAFAIVALVSTSQATLAQEAETITVPYSAGSNRTLGDAVSIVFPYSPLGRCLSFSDTDVKWDTGGAITTDATIEIVSSSEEEKRTTNLALGFQSTGKVAIGDLKANSTFSTDFTKETFRQNDANTLTLAFTAKADFGRRLIQSYALSSGAPSFTSDLESFRTMCGTHFIRGERRKSELSLLIRISTSSEQGKDALTTIIKKEIGAGFKLNAVTGEAGTKFSATYKSILEFARKAGHVRVEFRASGGPGIAAAGAAVLVDPTDFDALKSTITNVASLFDQDNSGIVEYMLLPNTSLGAPPAFFDLQRVEQIGILTRRLMMLGEAAERYAEVRRRFPGEFQKFFESHSAKVDVARSELVSLITECAAGKECEPPADDILNSLNFLEEMFETAEVSVSCQYQKASLLLPTVVPASSDPRILETISINLLGVSHNPDIIDFSSTEIMRLTSGVEIKDETAGFSGFALSEPDDEGERRVFGTIYFENLNPKAALSFDANAGKYDIDDGLLQRKRDDVLGSAFSLVAPGPQGVKVSHDVGFPPRDGCPVIQAQQ